MRFAASYRLPALICALSLVAPAGGAGEAATGEYRLKAAFLYRISQFVDWPEQALGPADQAFSICVLGSDPFGASLRELSTRSRAGRPITLQYPASTREARHCHMVYIESASRRMVSELSTLADLPVLTVSATERFVDQGGGVGFVSEQGKLRLEINVEVLRRANLKPSVKLLEVAARLVGHDKGLP